MGGFCEFRRVLTGILTRLCRDIGQAGTERLGLPAKERCRTQAAYFLYLHASELARALFSVFFAILVDLTNQALAVIMVLHSL